MIPVPFVGFFKRSVYVYGDCSLLFCTVTFAFLYGNSSLLVRPAISVFHCSAHGLDLFILKTTIISNRSLVGIDDRLRCFYSILIPDDCFVSKKYGMDISIFCYIKLNKYCNRLFSALKYFLPFLFIALFLWLICLSMFLQNFDFNRLIHHQFTECRIWANFFKFKVSGLRAFEIKYCTFCYDFLKFPQREFFLTLK